MMLRRTHRNEGREGGGECKRRRTREEKEKKEERQIGTGRDGGAGAGREDKRQGVWRKGEGGREGKRRKM